MNADELRNRRFDRAIARVTRRELKRFRQDCIEHHEAVRQADERRSRRMDQALDEMLERDAKLFRQERLQQCEPGPVAPVGGGAAPGSEKK